MFNLMAQSSEWYNQETAVHTTDSNILNRILEKDNEDMVSQHAVENGNCPPETLYMVIERDTSNKISISAAWNENCPPEALRMIVDKGQDNLLSRIAVSNDNCPSDSIHNILSRGEVSELSIIAAQHDNCSPETLHMVLKRGKNDSVSDYAARNENCSPETLRMVLKRGIENSTVAREAVGNKNCPLDLRIEWLKKNDKIGQYSEEDFNPNETNNDDLDELENLLSSNKFNLKKFSENEEWYNEDTAEGIKDPEILHKILEKGKNNFVSRIAAKNKHCSPKTLHMVLEKDNDNYVSRIAAENPNCSPETLHMILSRGDQTDTAQNAVLNRNCSPKTFNMIYKDPIRYRATFIQLLGVSNSSCPPDILERILSNRSKGMLSQHAAKNPNCPPDAKLKWLKETNQIGQYSEEEHNPNETNNDDLDELENLLSSNKFNLKKHAHEEWYDQENARNTKDPEILQKILKKNKNDWVSQIAARNKNCSSGTLHMVLERNKNDEVSRCAVKNKNCPPVARLKWLQNTNQIGNYSEEEHNPNETNNNDLDELENLL